MKILGLIAVLAAAVVMAGEVLSVDTIEPPTEHNAHWQITGHHTVSCVRDGMQVYGCNDDAGMYYTGQPINIAGYDGVYIGIGYSSITADGGDYCELYIENELFHTFREAGVVDGYFKAGLDDYYGVTDLDIKFRWVSDETGVNSGFRIRSIQIYGFNWGEGTPTLVLCWGSQDVTGHQSVDVYGMYMSNMACLTFGYSTEGTSQGWWAVDNVEVTADGESVLPLQSGGYGVEDFSSGGWHQDQHGTDGVWEIDIDHNTGDMSGENWQCDSDAHPGWQYSAETFSPWVAIDDDTETVTCEFDTWWNWLEVGDYASFGYYTDCGHPIFDPTFDDLDDWSTYDHGSDVVETTWGQIKADF
jgi:hypothetical protein